jgi:hypothetical protein
MITNYEAQRIVHSNEVLDKAIENLEYVEAGWGTVEIHLYAYKQILLELRACRTELGRLRS